MDIRFLLTLPFILSILALKRFPLISVRNISIIGVSVPLIIGAILLPYSIEFDRFEVVNSQLYVTSIKTSIMLTIIALSVFMLTILILDNINIVKKRIKNSMPDTVRSFFIGLETVPAIRIFTILSVFTIIGSSFIWFTFLQTGNIPYCSLDVSSKYFSGFTEKYIPLRPLYVLGQQILSVSGLVILLFILKGRIDKKFFLLILLLVLGTFTLLLTLKRGEMFFPIVTIIGGIILLNKIDKHIFVYLILLITIIFSTAFVIDPGHKDRPFAKKICEIILPKAEFSKFEFEIAKAKLPEAKQYTLTNRITKLFTDSFGIQIRETARLIYNFNLKGIKFFNGKTFIAGFLGFIPTEYFSFKEKYQIGRVTLSLFDLNKETSGGPRIGLIGEGYINFGYTGIFILPVIIGIVVWFLNEFYLSIPNTNFEYKILLMTIVFFILNHIVLGLFTDGSGAIQTFIIRFIIMSVIFVLLLYKNQLQRRLHPHNDK